MSAGGNRVNRHPGEQPRQTGARAMVPVQRPLSATARQAAQALPVIECTVFSGPFQEPVVRTQPLATPELELIGPLALGVPPTQVKKMLQRSEGELLGLWRKLGKLGPFGAGVMAHRLGLVQEVGEPEHPAEAVTDLEYAYLQLYVRGYPLSTLHGVPHLDRFLEILCEKLGARSHFHGGVLAEERGLIDHDRPSGEYLQRLAIDQPGSPAPQRSKEKVRLELAVAVVLLPTQQRLLQALSRAGIGTNPRAVAEVAAAKGVAEAVVRRQAGKISLSLGTSVPAEAVAIAKQLGLIH